MNRFIVTAAAGTLAATTTFAMAAALGGVDTTDLGSEATVVASCDTDGVAIDFQTEFDAVAGIQEVVAVEVSKIDERCEGQTIDVGLTDAAGNLSVDAVQGVVGTSGTETLKVVDGFPAESVETAAIVISG